jgi:alkylation response protein AidB-like acyl-CoA dehydrogenase
VTQAAVARESVEEFRERARAWLAANAAALGGPTADARLAPRRALTALHDAGFGAITWPVEYGGRGLSSEHQDAFSAELREYPSVIAGDLVTLGICAPTLLDFGS